MRNLFRQEWDQIAGCLDVGQWLNRLYQQHIICLTEGNNIVTVAERLSEAGGISLLSRNWVSESRLCLMLVV